MICKNIERMLILLTWWTDYQARRGQDRKTLFTDNMKNLVSTEFENSTSYELVKISGFDRKTRIVEESSIIKNPNRKRLLCFPDEIISIGEIVEFDNSNWICVNGDTTSKISDVGIIERCNNALQFYDSSSTLHQIPCIISKGSISLDEQKIISTLDSEIAVQISDNSITRQIPMNYVFKIGMRNYSVTDINDITVNGLLLIKMVYSEVEQVIPSYSLTILNGDSIQADINTPVQLNIQVKDRETIITSPLLTFTSSNNLIANVSNTGLVSFLSVGGVSISCKLDNDNLIQDSIGIEIVEEEKHNYTAVIDLGSISIIKTYSSTYTCTFKDNGIAITDTSVFYLTSDDGISETVLASIVSQDGVGNSCVVKGLGLGYVRLFVKNVGETVFSSGFRIQIKSLF